MLRTSFWGILIATLATVGCGDDAATPPRDLHGEIGDAETNAIANLCECFAELGESSEAACVTSTTDFYTTAEITCLGEVHDEFETELTANVDCQLDAFDDAQACLAAVVMCDATALGDCIDDAEAALDLCPEPATTVQAALDACTPNLYQVAVGAEVAAIGDLCECYGSLDDGNGGNYASHGECFSDYHPTLTQQQTTCLENVYEEFKAELAPQVECRVPFLEDAVVCVQAVNACDPTALGTCIMNAETASDGCPEPPQAVQDAIDACTAP